MQRQRLLGARIHVTDNEPSILYIHARTSLRLRVQCIVTCRVPQVHHLILEHHSWWRFVHVSSFVCKIMESLASALALVPFASAWSGEQHIQCYVNTWSTGACKATRQPRHVRCCSARLIKEHIPMENYSRLPWHSFIDEHWAIIAQRDAVVTRRSRQLDPFKMAS